MFLFFSFLRKSSFQLNVTTEVPSERHTDLGLLTGHPHGRRPHFCSSRLSRPRQTAIKKKKNGNEKRFQAEVLAPAPFGLFTSRHICLFASSPARRKFTFIVFPYFFHSSPISPAPSLRVPPSTKASTFGLAFVFFPHVSSGFPVLTPDGAAVPRATQGRKKQRSKKTPFFRIKKRRRGVYREVFFITLYPRNLREPT